MEIIKPYIGCFVLTSIENHKRTLKRFNKEEQDIICYFTNEPEKSLFDKKIVKGTYYQNQKYTTGDYIIDYDCLDYSSNYIYELWKRYVNVLNENENETILDLV